jgi:hypothetical protein
VKNKINLLHVPYSPSARHCDPAETLTGIFSAIEPNPLVYEPWPGEGFKPEVGFKMFYGDDAVFLKFLVKEKHFKAAYKQINDPVWNDSCVEFFIGFKDDEAYYNFEFNAIGTPLVGYGIDKKRELADPSLIKSIKCITVNNVTGDDRLPFNWELTIAIPFTLFFKHQVTTLAGLNCKGNFYKCGDELPEPHFLCWNNILADKPNFHLPQYFGQLIFE